MTVANAATSHCKKAIKLGISIFSRGFNSSKCKTMTKMAVARIKLLRNKRQVVVKQMRRDIAMLLQSGQDATARIRVEHVIREQNVLAANEFIELFCELIVARLSIIAKQRECPADLKEGISSLIFAAPRCSDIPELLAIRDIFEKKYGKDFVSAATDLRPSCGVNRMLIDKLSVISPSGEVKLKVMKEIAKEYQVEWDTKESEMELLKPPEQLIDGPKSFVSATSLPLKPTSKQSAEPTASQYSDIEEGGHYKDTKSAAEAAAESAKKAIAAAGAAAYLANRDSYQITQAMPGFRESLNGSNGSMNTSSGLGDNRFFPTKDTMKYQSKVSTSMTIPSSESSHYLRGEELLPDMDARRINRRHSYNVAPSSHSDDESEYDEEIEAEDRMIDVSRPLKRSSDLVPGKTYVRRHSYNNVQSTHANGIKFDDSDCDEDFARKEPPSTSGKDVPPNRRPPEVPPPAHQVHPKLPDYDVLAARFESLKYRKV